MSDPMANARHLRCEGTTPNGNPCKLSAPFIGSSITAWWCDRHSDEAPPDALTLGNRGKVTTE